MNQTGAHKTDSLANGKEESEVKTGSAAAPKRKRRNWRIPLVMMVLLVVSAVASFVIFRYVAPSVPPALVGVWQVTDGNLKGATLEFRWYGTAQATEIKDGKSITMDSKVEVEGNNIFLTTKGLGVGVEETVIQTIVELTDDKLVIRDQDNMTYTMTRVRR